MGRHVLSQAEFIEALNAAGGSPAEMARTVGCTERAIYARKAKLEALGVPFLRAPHAADVNRPAWAYQRSRSLEFDRGIVIVYSDAHYWPGEEPTLAWRALVTLCRELKPAAIVANGDLIDGAKISRFPASGWAKLPGMKAELDEMQARQADIVRAAPKAARFRTVGNHDLRLDRFFVINAEQFAGMPGTRLADFLPSWPESWSVRINDTFIKHRFRNGDHAAWNNVLRAGMSTVTGHTHKLEAKPIRGFRDARIWGVECGTLTKAPFDLADEGEGPFEYGEDNPVNWGSGFAVLTYHGGRLLPPEFCEVVFGKAWFRGGVVI
jgi:hypothetical protein